MAQKSGLPRRRAAAAAALLLALAALLFGCGKKDEQKEALAAILAKEIRESDYTTDSYALYEEAYDKALTVYNDKSADAERLKAAGERLEQAIGALVRRADFSALKELLAAEYPAENYTTESYAVYERAKERATAICADPNSKQSVVNSAKELLRSAIDGLHEKASAGRLASLLAALVPPDGYTTFSYERYLRVYNEAKDLYDQRSTSMNEEEAKDFAQNISICTLELESALEALERRGDPTALKEAYQRINAVYSAPSEATGGANPAAYYTEASYASLGQALSQAATVIESGDYSQTEMDKYKTDLETAFAALVVQSNTSDLEELILTATNFYLRNLDIYSSESYLRLNNAVNAAKDLLAGDSNPAQTVIDAAYQDIITAISLLEVINVEPGGRTDYRLDTAALIFGAKQTTVGDYMKSNDDFLAAVKLLESSYITVSNTEEGLTLFVGNGMAVSFDFGRIRIEMQNGVSAVTTGWDIASVAGVCLGMTPVEISTILNGPPTYKTGEGEGGAIYYVDGQRGYELKIEFDAHNTAAAIECILGE